MYKKDIVNFLFVVSFSFFGIGNYISAASSPSVGYLVSSFPYLLIILFYLIDILYQRQFALKVNEKYFLMLLYILVCISSLFVAHYKGYPNSTMFIIIGRSILLFLPFQAFILLFMYNKSNTDGIINLMLKGLMLLLVVNLIGYFGLGLTNQGHNLEGRLNLPFFGGLYTASSIMIFINLILISQIIRLWSHPEKSVWWRFIFIGLNLFTSFFINSRMSTMLFLLVLLLIVTRTIRSKLVFWVSLLTLPIALNVRFVFYQIVSIPLFASILQRVDFEDVTTFNGRSYLWERGLDWLLYDQRGLFFGNGFSGQYFLGSLYDIGLLWNPENPRIMHFHSTTFEILTSQGLLGFSIFIFLFYKLYFHYRSKYILRTESGDIFASIVLFSFFLQIDTILYMGGFGFILFSLLVAPVALNFEPSKNDLKRNPRDQPLKLENDRNLELA